MSRGSFAIARIRRRTLLLDRDGLDALGPANHVRPLDWLRGRGQEPRARYERRALDLSIASWRDVPSLSDLKRHIGDRPRYLSVGHAGLDERCLGAFGGLPGSRCGVFLHDTIPLDWPATQSAGSTQRFKTRLEAVARYADCVFGPLESTAIDIDRHLKAQGWSGSITVAPPGLTPLEPGPIPQDLPTDRPYFVVLGTVEPRKNHSLLLDVWESLPAPKPRLIVLGRRGWRNETVFQRMDKLAGTGDLVERNNLDDGAVASILKGARALLFPSLAEGFGYPPLEAASLGVNVISAPLAQTKELLGDSIVYASVDEMYQWQEAILDLMTREPKRLEKTPLPQWFVHFDLVLKSLD